MARSDVNEDEVRAEAQAILDKFFVLLKDVPEDFDVAIQRKAQMREPKTVQDPDYKEKFLNNAPNRDMDHVLSEKRSW